MEIAVKIKRSRWTPEDALVLQGITPEGRSYSAACVRRHNLKQNPSSSSKKSWSDFELKMLKEYWGDTRLCKMLPQRSIAAITSMASKLGYTSKRKWSVAEETVLRMKLDSFMQQFPERSLQSIYYKIGHWLDIKGRNL